MAADPVDAAVEAFYARGPGDTSGVAMRRALVAAVAAVLPGGVPAEAHVCTCQQPAVVDAIHVECSACGAPVHDACLDERGVRMREPHPERARAAVARHEGGCSSGFEDRCRFEAALRQLASSADCNCCGPSLGQEHAPECETQQSGPLCALCGMALGQGSLLDAKPTAPVPDPELDERGKVKLPHGLVVRAGIPQEAWEAFAVDYRCPACAAAVP